MRPLTRPHVLLPLLAALILCACSPQFNWRDYRSPDAPFAVLFPDKPATHSRVVDLDGMSVNMTMAAAQVDGAMFAVGTGEAPDAAHAKAALTAMKTALVKNIGATITKEASAASAGDKQTASIDIEASGTQNGRPMLLVGHFEARDKRFYQVIVMGPKNAISTENVEMFMSSFKLN